jgi:inner membrane protein
MDPISHALLGASAAISISDKKKITAAAFVGSVAAMAPDLDTLIRSANDPLLVVEFHRQFTHSLLFVPIGAAIVTFFLWWFMKNYLDLKWIYIFSFVGYATHGLMDAFTSYGTQLFWPFTNTRVALNSVAVVDPLVTLCLILFVLLALSKKKQLYAQLGILAFLLFMIFGQIQGHRASTVIEKMALERGHTPQQLVARPSIGNQILWRVNYIHEGTIYISAVRAGIFSEIKIHEGGSMPLVTLEEDFAQYESTILYEDLKRFRHFSDGYLARNPENPEIIGDARYSMTPTSLIPLWGVEVDTLQTDRHLPFLYFREIDEEQRKEFFDMLLGQ